MQGRAEAHQREKAADLFRLSIEIAGLATGVSQVPWASVRRCLLFGCCLITPCRTDVIGRARRIGRVGPKPVESGADSLLKQLCGESGIRWGEGQIA